MPGGQPTKYNPEYAEQAAKLCKLGATDDDLADFFEVSRQTIHNWQAAHQEFFDALKVGKAEADDRVERSLYQRAVGYSHPEDKIFMPAGKDAPVIVPTVKHYPPDTTAMIFWLKNRRPAAWRDVQAMEHTGKDGEPLPAADPRELARRVALLLTKGADYNGEAVH